MKKVLVLGAGKMIDALLTGLDRENFEFDIYTPSFVRAELLAKKIGAKVIKQLNRIESYDEIVLAMKPQDWPNVLEILKGRLSSKQGIISLMAAITFEALEKCGASKFIRLMPNMGVKEKKGVTLLSSKNYPEDEKNEWIEKLRSTGKIFYLSERELDLLTLFSGCAPAYIYFLLQESLEFSKKHHIDPQMTTDIFWKSLQGTLELAPPAANDAQTRIAEITSKGGVTQAVLSELRYDQDYFQKAFNQGAKKISEISQRFSE